MKIKKILLSLLTFSTLSFAMDAFEIVTKVDTRDDGDNIISNMSMVLIDKANKQRVRSMRTFTKDFGVDTYKTIFFLAPSDVKNTAFLTFDYDDDNKDDDQWLYLPALKKTKRIASTDKSGSFMGSDFSYSDMTKPDLTDYNYKIVKEKKVGKHNTWIIERVPKTQAILDETGYKKSYLFVRQDNFVVVRAMHYLDDGKKKYMNVKKLEKIDGIWIATEIEMKTTKNKKRLHSTILQFNNVKLNQNLNENKFSVRQIEKGI